MMLPIGLSGSLKLSINGLPQSALSGDASVAKDKYLQQIKKDVLDNGLIDASIFAAAKTSKTSKVEPGLAEMLMAKGDKTKLFSGEVPAMMLVLGEPGDMGSLLRSLSIGSSEMQSLYGMPLGYPANPYLASPNNQLFKQPTQSYEMPPYTPQMQLGQIPPQASHMPPVSSDLSDIPGFFLAPNSPPPQPGGVPIQPPLPNTNSGLPPSLVAPPQPQQPPLPPVAPQLPQQAPVVGRSGVPINQAPPNTPTLQSPGLARVSPNPASQQNVPLPPALGSPPGAPPSPSLAGIGGTSKSAEAPRLLASDNSGAAGNAAAGKNEMTAMVMQLVVSLLSLVTMLLGQRQQQKQG